MNIKSFAFLLAIAGVILVSAIALTNSSLFERSENHTSLPTPTQSVTIQTKVIIDASDEDIFIEYEIGDEDINQPFSILKEALEKYNIPLEVETYDFGVFVKSINGLESSNEKAWIYFVNGESGQVAADKMNLEKGDLVEWKYIAPSE